MTTPAAAFRELVSRPEPATIPLALDPLSAKLAEQAGFEGLYVGGGTLGYLNTSIEAALPLTDICQAATRIRAASPLPIILDGQCGWGDPMHMDYTIRMVEAVGVAAIEIEDQHQPKRAHHHIGIEHMVPLELMVEKIRVAVAARRDPDFYIIARTNALRGHHGPDLDDAVRRAEAYRKAGADMLLILPKTPEEAVWVGERIEGPLFYMMMGGVTSIGLTPAELAKLGYRVVVDAVTPFYAHHIAMRRSYEALARGEIDPTVLGDYEAETERVHDALDLERLLEIERRSVEN